MKKIVYTQNDIQKVAKKIFFQTTSQTLCFHGEMGAGKTTLIKALVKELGDADEVSSPTFSIVNEYHSTKGNLLAYHFDFYRLNDEMEALDMGFEDYLSQNVWIFIEWPEKIPSFIPQDSMNLQIKIIDETTREISLISS